MDLGEGLKHVVRGGRFVKAISTPPTSANPFHQPVTQAPQKSEVIASRKRARPKKHENNYTAAQ
jgi:hypothetical protein